MDRNSVYFKQVQLLVRILPVIAAEIDFALKGGTAINLFVQDLPRLSVDIDLVYLPVKDRNTSLTNIHAALARIANGIEDRIAGTRVQKPDEALDALRLLVRLNEAHIKIELSPVLRGTVWSPEIREVGPKVEDLFGYAEIQVVSHADLYAGIICAALDRQHPRDLFDMKLFFEREGWNFGRKLTSTLLVYLISHSRPIAELLAPNKKDFSGIFELEFAAMATEPTSVEELNQTRNDLITAMHKSFADDDREFLLSFKRKTPDWSLLDLKGVEELPAVRWKMINLSRMADDKHEQALGKLEAVLRGP